MRALGRGPRSGRPAAALGPAAAGEPASRTHRRRVLTRRRLALLRRPLATAAGLGVPWWGVISAAAAPLLLVIGWTVAAMLQPRPFDAISGTVSALAGAGAADRWVMTLAFVVSGACEVITGLALRPAAAAGRLILMAGGAAGILVAANPEHAGGSLAHAFWAGVGFAALVAWPSAAWRRGHLVPWGLRPAVSASAAGVLLGLLSLVRRGADHCWRAGRPGRAGYGHSTGRVAAGRGLVLPEPDPRGLEIRGADRPAAPAPASSVQPPYSRVSTGTMCHR